MTAALAILKYYRAHQKALDKELAGEDFAGLRPHLQIFASYWRGAQHLLRKPESELQPLELRSVRMAASEVLREMALCARQIPLGSAALGLYYLEDTDEPHVRREFADSFIKEQLNRWYWGFRSTVRPGLSFFYEWLGTGVERMLSVKLMLGNAETLHTLYFTLPGETGTLGERLAALNGLVDDASQQMQTLVLAPGNWPTDTQVEDAAEEAARRIADTMYRRLTPAQLSQLRNREDVILTSFRAALKRN
jgi:hypothetical protein